MKPSRVPDLLNYLDRHPETKKQAFTVFEGITWLALLGLCALYFMAPEEITQTQRLLMVASIGFWFAWGMLFFRYLVTKSKNLSTTYAIGTLLGIITLALVDYAFMVYPIDVHLLYTVIIVACGVLTNWRVTSLAILVAAGAHVAPAVLANQETGPIFWMQETFHIMGLVISGLVALTLSGMIQQQTRGLQQKNRNLETILDASRLVTQAISLEETLGQVARLIVEELPATLCKICLMDEQQGVLTGKGVFSQRPQSNFTAETTTIPLNVLKQILPNIETSGRVRIIQRGQKRYDLITQMFEAYKDLQSIAILPLMEQGKFLGILQVGEARGWHRTPFDEDRINVLETLANQLAVSIHNYQLYDLARQQYQRIAILNEVARAIGSTIEYPELLELIYQQLSKILAADTYYVAMYNQAEHTLEFHILIDGGERFPHNRIPLGDGFSSYVLLNRQPLLVRHLTEEMETLPVKPITMGQDRLSESWLGVPLVTGDHLIGLLAIASYQPNAFSQEDVSLLESLAQQAALALDNARHHREVETQALYDSLTGAFNHGTFLRKLEQSLQEATTANARAGLIMLDLDYFKQYNDKYGHVVGDQVLVASVQAIQAALDGQAGYVGRWGGEEFAVGVLCNEPAELMSLAQAIRENIAATRCTDREGQPIPAPTVSQGIAVYPDQAGDVLSLVLLADQTLYRAKSGGRNQIWVSQARESHATQGH